MTQSTLQLERTVVDLETGVRGYMLTDDESFLEPYHRGRQRIASALTAESPSQQRALDARAVERDPRDLDDYVVRLHRTARPAARVATSVLDATTEGKQRLDELRAEFAALSAAQQQALTLAAPRRLAGAAPADAVGSPPAAAPSPPLLLSRSASSSTASCCARSAASRAPPTGSPHGDLDTRVPATGVGEIGELGAAFNAMAAALAAREEDLRVQTDRLHGILDHTTTTISVKDRDGRYLLVNDAVAAGDGPGRRRRASARPTTRSSRPTSPPRSASPTSRSCAPASPPSTSATSPAAAAPSSSSSSRSRTPTASSTRPARWAPTSPSAAARWPRPSTPRARSPSSWPT